MIYPMSYTQMVSRGRSAQGAMLFNRCLQRGLSAEWLGRLLGRKMRLNGLDAPLDGNGRDLGIQTVPIRKITGSEGRAADFDRFFRPLQDYTRERWLNIWQAVMNGLPLPPVELVCVGDTYYVRDGHHRISVAAALGQLDIEAHVIQWNK